MNIFTWERILDFVLMLVLIALFFVIFFCIADSVGTTKRTIKARGISSEYKPAWTQTSMIMVGKVAAPQIIHHPESWSIKLLTEEDEVLSCDCPKSVYDNFVADIDLLISVSSGRFSKGTYCKGILWP